MWAEVSSSAPRLLHKGLLVSSIKWRCLLRMLCLVRSVMNVDCFLLKDSSLVLAVGLGPEINSWACLLVLLRTRHLVKCWLSIQCFVFCLIFCLETPQRWLRSNNLLNRTCRTWMKIFHGLLGRRSWLYPCPHHWDGLISVAYLIFLSMTGICDSCWPVSFQPLIGHLPSAVYFPPP